MNRTRTARQPTYCNTPFHHNNTHARARAGITHITHQRPVVTGAGLALVLSQVAEVVPKVLDSMLATCRRAAAEQQGSEQSDARHGEMDCVDGLLTRASPYSTPPPIAPPPLTASDGPICSGPTSACLFRSSQSIR